MYTVVTEMTYTVLSGTLNSTIPYQTMYTGGYFFCGHSVVTLLRYTTKNVMYYVTGYLKF